MKNINLGILPPQAIEMEEAVLGALMLEKGAVEVLQILDNPEAFYTEAHQSIFRAILDLNKDCIPIDMRTVAARLKKNGNLEISGGQYYIAELTSKVASSDNIISHAMTILEQWYRRRLILLGNDVIRDSYEDTTDVFLTLENMQQVAYEIQNQHSPDHIINAQDLWLKTIKDIEERKRIREKNEFTGIISGYLTVDRVTHGWQNSDLIIIAARPGMGKTAFTIGCAVNAAKKDVPVLVFSLEMSSGQLMMRIISGEAQIDSSKLRGGNVEDYDFSRIMNKGAIAGKPLYIDDTAGLSITKCRAIAQRMKSEHNIGLIIVDYIQLMSGDKSQYKGNREQEISQISRGLKVMAKDLDVPVIALSQLSRAVETRGGDKVPQLSDLRESGSLEQDADVVGFLYRPEYYGITDDENGNSLRGIGKLIIAKHRNGILQHCFLKFISKYAQFVDYEETAAKLSNDVPNWMRDDLDKQLLESNLNMDDDNKDTPF